MSILVKDMKMPTRCWDCPFYKITYDDSYCGLMQKDVARRTPTLRPDDCPLVEVELNSCEYWDSESYFCALRRPQAELIKRGQWIKNEGRSGWHCSYCGKDDLYAYPYTENNERELQDFYCPNCGAQMIDEGKNDRT